MVAATGTVSPSNVTLATPVMKLYAAYYSSNGMSMGSVEVYPLTQNAGLGAINPNVFTVSIYMSVARKARYSRLIPAVRESISMDH